MAEKGLDTRYTFIKLLQMNGADGQTMEIGDALSEQNDMIRDAVILPANDVMSHSDLRATSIPTPQIVKIGDGWDASVVQWDAFKDDISLFKDRCQIPEDAIKFAGDKAGKRAQIERQHLEGFGQGVQNHLIYGTSAADPEKFDGLDVRYKTPDSTDPWDPSSSGDYGVLDNSGTGDDTTSIWLIQWAESKVSLRTPKNDPNSGIKRTDKGSVLISAENSKNRWDYITEFEWAVGLSIKDVRAVVRIRNIESAVANVTTDTIKKIIEAREMFNGNETVWMYTNRRIRTHFRIMAEAKQNVLYSSENPYNIPLLMFGDMPIRRCDAILNTETAVAAA